MLKIAYFSLRSILAPVRLNSCVFSLYPEPSRILIIIQISILMNRLAEKESLHLHILLDLNRSTRPGSSSTATTLLPLLRAFPDRVHVSLFRSPSLRGIMAKIVPPRFNEGWGTWHAKIYGVDDELIISGCVFACSTRYASNRLWPEPT